MGFFNFSHHQGLTVLGIIITGLLILDVHLRNQFSKIHYEIILVSQSWTSETNLVPVARTCIRSNDIRFNKRISGKSEWIWNFELDLKRTSVQNLITYMVWLFRKRFRNHFEPRKTFDSTLTDVPTKNKPVNSRIAGLILNPSLACSTQVHI